MDDKNYDQAVLKALETISNNLQVQGDQMGKIVSKLDNTHERVVRLEAARHDRDIGRVEVAMQEVKNQNTLSLQEIKGRIVTLELANANRMGEMRGANKLADVVHKFLPWIVSGFFVVATYVMQRNG